MSNNKEGQREALKALLEYLNTVDPSESQKTYDQRTAIYNDLKKTYGQTVNSYLEKVASNGHDVVLERIFVRDLIDNLNDDLRIEKGTEVTDNVQTTSRDDLINDYLRDLETRTETRQQIADRSKRSLEQLLKTQQRNTQTQQREYSPPPTQIAGQLPTAQAADTVDSVRQTVTQFIDNIENDIQQSRGTPLSAAERENLTETLTNDLARRNLTARNQAAVIINTLQQQIPELNNVPRDAQQRLTETITQTANQTQQITAAATERQPEILATPIVAVPTPPTITPPAQATTPAVDTTPFPEPPIITPPTPTQQTVQEAFLQPPTITPPIQQTAAQPEPVTAPQQQRPTRMDATWLDQQSLPPNPSAVPATPQHAPEPSTPTRQERTADLVGKLQTDRLQRQDTATQQFDTMLDAVRQVRASSRPATQAASTFSIPFIAGEVENYTERGYSPRKTSLLNITEQAREPLRASRGDSQAKLIVVPISELDKATKDRIIKGNPQTKEAGVQINDNQVAVITSFEAPNQQRESTPRSGRFSGVVIMTPENAARLTQEVQQNPATLFDLLKQVNGGHITNGDNARSPLQPRIDRPVEIYPEYVPGTKPTNKVESAPFKPGIVVNDASPVVTPSQAIPQTPTRDTLAEPKTHAQTARDVVQTLERASGVTLNQTQRDLITERVELEIATNIAAPSGNGQTLRQGIEQTFMVAVRDQTGQQVRQADIAPARTQVAQQLNQGLATAAGIPIPPPATQAPIQAPWLAGQQPPSRNTPTPDASLTVSPEVDMMARNITTTIGARLNRDQRTQLQQQIARDLTQQIEAGVTDPQTLARQAAATANQLLPNSPALQTQFAQRANTITDDIQRGVQQYQQQRQAVAATPVTPPTPPTITPPQQAQPQVDPLTQRIRDAEAEFRRTGDKDKFAQEMQSIGDAAVRNSSLNRYMINGAHQIQFETKNFLNDLNNRIPAAQKLSEDEITAISGKVTQRVLEKAAQVSNNDLQGTINSTLQEQLQLQLTARGGKTHPELNISGIRNLADIDKLTDISLRLAKNQDLLVAVTASTITALIPSAADQAKAALEEYLRPPKGFRSERGAGRYAVENEFDLQYARQGLEKHETMRRTTAGILAGFLDQTLQLNEDQKVILEQKVAKNTIEATFGKLILVIAKDDNHDPIVKGHDEKGNPIYEYKVGESEGALADFVKGYNLSAAQQWMIKGMTEDQRKEFFENREAQRRQYLLDTLRIVLLHELKENGLLTPQFEKQLKTLKVSDIIRDPAELQRLAAQGIDINGNAFENLIGKSPHFIEFLNSMQEKERKLATKKATDTRNPLNWLEEANASNPFSRTFGVSDVMNKFSKNSLYSYATNLPVRIASLGLEAVGVRTDFSNTLLMYTVFDGTFAKKEKIFESEKAALFRKTGLNIDAVIRTGIIPYDRLSKLDSLRLENIIRDAKNFEKVRAYLDSNPKTREKLNRKYAKLTSIHHQIQSETVQALMNGRIDALPGLWAKRVGTMYFNRFLVNLNVGFERDIITKRIVYAPYEQAKKSFDTFVQSTRDAVINRILISKPVVAVKQFVVQQGEKFAATQVGKLLVSLGAKRLIALIPSGVTQVIAAVLAVDTFLSKLWFIGEQYRNLKNLLKFVLAAIFAGIIGVILRIIHFVYAIVSAPWALASRLAGFMSGSLGLGSLPAASRTLMFAGSPFGAWSIGLNLGGWVGGWAASGAKFLGGFFTGSISMQSFLGKLFGTAWTTLGPLGFSATVLIGGSAIMSNTYLAAILPNAFKDGPDAAPDAVTLETLAPVQISKTANPATLPQNSAGNEITYSINISAPPCDPVITVTDTLPTTVTYVPGSINYLAPLTQPIQTIVTDDTGNPTLKWTINIDPAAVDPANCTSRGILGALDFRAANDQATRDLITQILQSKPHQYLVPNVNDFITQGSTNNVNALASVAIMQAESQIAEELGGAGIGAPQSAGGCYNPWGAVGLHNSTAGLTLCRNIGGVAFTRFSDYTESITYHMRTINNRLTDLANGRVGGRSIPANSSETVEYFAALYIPPTVHGNCTEWEAGKENTDFGCTTGLNSNWKRTVACTMANKQICQFNIQEYIQFRDGLGGSTTQVPPVSTTLIYKATLNAGLPDGKGCIINNAIATMGTFSNTSTGTVTVGDAQCSDVPQAPPEAQAIIDQLCAGIPGANGKTVIICPRVNQVNPPGTTIPPEYRQWTLPQLQALWNVAHRVASNSNYANYAVGNYKVEITRSRCYKAEGVVYCPPSSTTKGYAAGTGSGWETISGARLVMITDNVVGFANKGDALEWLYAHEIGHLAQHGNVDGELAERNDNPAYTAFLPCYATEKVSKYGYESVSENHADALSFYMTNGERGINGYTGGSNPLTYNIKTDYPCTYGKLKGPVTVGGRDVSFFGGQEYGP